ncbi:hypothetical protein GJ744_005994 [Endocarpon pusillum]|uniref:Rhodanese domain-containing protein n=1 Tax=Endocarpon pusillum TaxID=364733 RepID=A0A8H7A4C8_9EURO|nr:hypothetical protein GJ744_005994 [Endocarpon pusillum]
MTTENAPWYAAYPKPKNTSPDSISRSEVLDRLDRGEQPGRDFLLVDLRRNDHEGGTIRGSLNLPAQSLYHSLPTLYNLCDTGKIDIIIWYCGSSRGRGTRAAGWFDDMIKEKGHKSMKSVILLEGVSGWAAAGKEYSDMMDGYEKEVWEKM